MLAIALTLSLSTILSSGDGASPAAADARRDVIRVGGDLELKTERVNDVYRCGESFTEAALPVGYPAPTPPGAIEIKSYPAVRRAQVSGTGSNAGGMRGGFWPLFNHIKKNDIAMTAPVEMIYDGIEIEDGGDTPTHVSQEGADWTMSFLYRTEEDGPTGQDGEVEVIDAAPVTVIAIGLTGPMTGDRIVEHANVLMNWIEQSGDWEVAGDVRTFGYNGPYIPQRIRWSEVQIPIRAIEREQASERRPL